MLMLHHQCRWPNPSWPPRWCSPPPHMAAGRSRARPPSYTSCGASHGSCREAPGRTGGWAAAGWRHGRRHCAGRTGPLARWLSHAASTCCCGGWARRGPRRWPTGCRGSWRAGRGRHRPHHRSRRHRHQTRRWMAGAAGAKGWPAAPSSVSGAAPTPLCRGRTDTQWSTGPSASHTRHPCPVSRPRPHPHPPPTPAQAPPQTKTDPRAARPPHAAGGWPARGLWPPPCGPPPHMPWPT
mmetsp:Transcript_939/g.2086  ORF Transcript_939/g.2086 Transcript_939/m.2086 type:complete len:238 (-) Transcript_939:1921-2634(-)